MEPEILRKIQEIELYILKEFKKICEENNISYFLVAGTLLGAIRHKGFIPWDDDIDVGMLRPDFDKFIEVCKTKLDTTKFFLQIPENEVSSADYGIARLRLNNTHIVIESRKNINCHDGFFIELFPYDNIPDNIILAKIYGNGFAVLKRVFAIRKGYISNPRTLYAKLAVRTAQVLLKTIKTKTIEKWLKKYPYRYSKKRTKQVLPLTEGYAHENHDFKTVSELSTAMFEDELFLIPKEYDKYLTEQYGDYMKLPPIEQQKNHHIILEMDFGDCLKLSKVDNKVIINKGT